MLTLITGAVWTASPGAEAAPTCDGRYRQPGWVSRENALQGTSSWKISAQGNIDGYLDHVSAQCGDTVRMFISTTYKTSFHVDAYRMGYYGGLGARLIWSSSPVAGKVQPTPAPTASTNMVEANWDPSLSFTIDETWPPGDYLLRMTLYDNRAKYVPLTVRDDLSTAPMVIQSDVATWQAYNDWGGYSLYKGPSGYDSRSRIVSYDRPYRYGDGFFLQYDYPLVSFAEEMGFDVTYTTDIDLHERPDLLKNHKTLVVPSHSEYWSTRMRAAAEGARDSGVNIAFLGANNVYQVTRFEPSPLGADRHEVVYRVAKDDPLNGVDNKNVTVRYRDAPINNPETSLVGQQSDCGSVSIKANMVISDASQWEFTNTGLHNGDVLPNLVGYEVDRVWPNIPGPPNRKILASSPFMCGSQQLSSNMTYYSAPSGAGVFSTGTVTWICVLNASCRDVSGNDSAKDTVRAITLNVLTAFSRGPAGPSPDVAPPDTTVETMPPLFSSSSTATFELRSTETGTFQCALDGAGWTTCPAHIDLTALQEGGHTFESRAVDLAGNFDETPARAAWSVDTVAPTTAFLSSPASLSDESSPTFGFSAGEPATYECSLDDQAWASCASPLTLSWIDDGLHALRVRATDRAGNNEAVAATYSWTLQTAAPHTRIESAPQSLSNDPISRIGFSSPESSVFQCRLDLAEWSRCSSPAQYSGLPDGPHQLEVRAIDGAGVPDPDPAETAWSLDTQAPSTVIDDGPSGEQTSTTALFSFHSADAVTFDCKLDSESWEPCASTVAYDSLAGGDHSFSVRAIDAAGNVETGYPTRSWTVIPPPRSDVRITTAVDDSISVVTGDDFQLQVVADNAGPAPATGVHVSIELPADVQVEALPDGCTGAPTISCDVGTLSAGASASLSLRLAPEKAGLVVQNVAVSQDASTIDADVTNDRRSVTAYAAGSDCTIMGTPQPDDLSLLASGAADVVCGFDGDDVVAGLGGDDELVGGAGFDRATFEYSPARVVADLGSGTATGEGLDALRGIEAVTGSTFGDNLYGSPGPNALFGGPGADTFIGGRGADVLDGGPGSDTAAYFDSASGVSVDLSGTNPGSGGTAEGDVAVATEIATGTSYDDVLSGSKVANTLVGGAGNDTLLGGDAADGLNGGPGSDDLQGGNGSDALSGGPGGDSLNGGAGTDSVLYSDSPAPVTVDLSAAPQSATGGYATGELLTAVESVTGSSYDDRITGSDSSNILNGAGGNDVIDGRDGSDIVCGGPGADTLDGGLGPDTLSYSESPAAVTVDLSAVPPSATGGNATGDSPVGFENINGSSYGDALTGSQDGNFIMAGGGNDRIDGLAGDDSLMGGAGADVMDGGVGTDGVSFADSGAGVTVNLGVVPQLASGGNASGDWLGGFENVTGTGYPDVLTGSLASNYVMSIGGDDIVSVIDGIAGNDTVLAGTGRDACSGDLQDQLSGCE